MVRKDGLMIKKLIQDESGLSTIEILVGMIVLVLLAIISFAALRVGINNAAENLGTHADNLVQNSKAEGGAGSHNINWGTQQP
jgi:Flp pilus assembly pilin Flp